MEVHAIYGPPGTGKTSALIGRAKAASKRSTFLAFTRTAAKEISSRAGVKSTTVHAMAYAMACIDKAQVVDSLKLRDFSNLIGYPFSGAEEAPSVADECLQLVNVAGAAKRRVFDVWESSDRRVNPDVLEVFDKTYVSWKRTYGYVDFNDMLRLASTSGEIPLVGRLYVDEAQDLSALQWDVVDLLSTVAESVCFAGDDDQAIFAWAGADPHGMKAREKSREVLAQSFRVPRSVYELATKISSRIEDRVEKHYLPVDKAGRVDSFTPIQALPTGGELKGTLALYRDCSQRSFMEDYLRQQKVPYSILGTGPKSWFDDRYAQAVRAYLEFVAGGQITKSQEALLGRTIAPSAKGQVSVGTKLPWQYALEIPMDRLEYLSAVDLSSKPYVLLGTIHSAKGMEANQVVVSSGMGYLTESNVDSHEHRVWYVAVTRTKDKLFITPGDNPYDFPV